MEVYDRRLILVVGKGGVGRSTIAAAIAARSAAQGRHTLLYEANANDRFGSYFDKPPVGPELTQLAPELYAVNTTPAAALAEYGMMVLKFRSIYEMVFENRVTRAFLRAVPGLDDYAVLGKAWFHTTEDRRGKPLWDSVVFDMPASGHSLSMLKIPSVIVDTVPDGPLTRDARTLWDLLRNPARTSCVMVTLAEEMPVNEAIELEAKLIALGIVPKVVVCNQIYPEHFPAGTPVARILDALASETPASPLRELAAHSLLSRSRHQLNAQYLADLRRRTRTPVLELPMVFASSLAPEHIRGLAQRL